MRPRLATGPRSPGRRTPSAEKFRRNRPVTQLSPFRGNDQCDLGAHTILTPARPRRSARSSASPAGTSPPPFRRCTRHHEDSPRARNRSQDQANIDEEERHEEVVERRKGFIDAFRRRLRLKISPANSAPTASGKPSQPAVKHQRHSGDRPWGWVTVPVFKQARDRVFEIPGRRRNRPPRTTRSWPRSRTRAAHRLGGDTAIPGHQDRRGGDGRIQDDARRRRLRRIGQRAGRRVQLVRLRHTPRHTPGLVAVSATPANRLGITARPSR